MQFEYTKYFSETLQVDLIKKKKNKALCKNKYFFHNCKKL